MCCLCNLTASSYTLLNRPSLRQLPTASDCVPSPLCPACCCQCLQQAPALSCAQHCMGVLRTWSPTSLSSDMRPHHVSNALRPWCISSDTDCGFAGTDNAGHFFVGTQDRQLRGQLGSMPAGPVLFVAADGLHLEQPTPQQQQWAEQVGSAFQQACRTVQPPVCTRGRPCASQAFAAPSTELSRWGPASSRRAACHTCCCVPAACKVLSSAGGCLCPVPAAVYHPVGSSSH